MDDFINSKKEIGLSRFGYQTLVLVTVLDMLVTVLLVFSVGVFGWCCWGRDWLLYPNYNYLSWGWGAAVLSAIFHALTSLLDLRKLGRLNILKIKLISLLFDFMDDLYSVHNVLFI